MDELLEQQLINELRSLLKGINERYKDFFHCNLLTLIDLEDVACDKCVESGCKCIRCVIAFEEKKLPRGDIA